LRKMGSPDGSNQCAQYVIRWAYTFKKTAFAKGRSVQRTDTARPCPFIPHPPRWIPLLPLALPHRPLLLVLP
jgi:hypothetical protein